MKYLRKWDLPTLDEPIIEHLEQIPQWGQHYFYYCRKCRSIYANVMLSPEDCSTRQWRGVSGLCLTCPPDKWTIRGNLENGPTIGWQVGQKVLQYQLDREIDFLCHPNHPHNKEN